ncbi:hypothetical protein ACHAW6_015905 [Cyclotella cf. meneghiniana]
MASALSPANAGVFASPSNNATYEDDDDMTEDEVALMVKNALRKARKAMSNPSSSDAASDDDDDDDDDDDSSVDSGHDDKSSIGDSLEDIGGISNTVSECSAAVLDVKGSLSGLREHESQRAEEEASEMTDDDLARRIEEEIKGARAFAEKVYYGDRSDRKTAMPPTASVAAMTGGARGGKSLASLETECVSNKASKPAVTAGTPLSMGNAAMPGSMPSSLASPRERIKEGRVTPTSNMTGQRPPMSPHTPTNPHGMNSKNTQRTGTVPASLRLDIGENEENEKVEAAPKKDGTASPAPKASPSPAQSIKVSQASHQQQPSPNKQTQRHGNLPPSPSPLSPSTLSNATPQSHREHRQHRQVVFRHPYPLPPPPILPRPDAVIISENDVRQAALRFKIAEPDADLQALIQAAEDESLVRRSNACGALKVLASKDGNKAKMCRTRGLLEALVVASREDAVDSDALDARTRAVTTLLYLAEPKDNRLVVARHPHVLEVLVKVIEEDTGEARLRACCALATLAKTPQNRGLICGTVRLPAVLSDLMAKNAKEEKKKEEEDRKKKEEGQPVQRQKEEIRRTDTGVSRDDSRDDDLSGSFVSEDDRLLSNTYSGTFSHGSGTFTDDQYYSDEDDASEGEGSEEDYDENEDGYSSAGYSVDDGSIQEEGVEMQISSLKKLNIENHSDFLARSQLSACATLTHLTKHCANSPLLAQDTEMLENLLFIASIFDNPLHTRCIEILCNLTRFPSNNTRLAAMSKFVDTLLTCGKSKIPEDRLWAIRAMQNLCSDASSKVMLATSPILTMLSTSAMRKEYDEQCAAVGALMNLSTEPGSIVPLTNTKTVVATLVHLAHSPNTPAAVRKIACDSLATIGLWLQTLASAGTVPEEIPFSPLPTHSATGWLRWES